MHTHAGRKVRILAGRENKATRRRGMSWLCSGSLMGTDVHSKSFHIEEIYLIKSPRQWSQKRFRHPVCCLSLTSVRKMKMAQRSQMTYKSQTGSEWQVLVQNPSALQLDKNSLATQHRAPQLLVVFCHSHGTP